MKRLFESDKEIQNFITSFKTSNKEHKEAMETVLSTIVRGTGVKKHPTLKIEAGEGNELSIFFPIELKCYQLNDSTKIIPTMLTSDGFWGGVQITPDSLQEVFGIDYNENQSDDSIEVTVTALGRDFTADALKVLDQSVELV